MNNYEIVDRQTGAVVGHAKTLKGARRSVDRRDNAYGSYRYFSRPIAQPELTLAQAFGWTEVQS